MDRYSILEDHRPESVTSWSYSEDPSTSNDHFIFNLTQLAFHVCISSNRQTLRVCKVFDVNQLVPRRHLDPVRGEVRMILRTAFETGEKVREFDILVATLQALERLAELEDSLRKAESDDKGWAAGDISDWKDVLNNPHGLDVSTIQDTAFDILGKTPAELVKDIPQSWRVIHIESIMRPDLAKRFRRYREELRDNLNNLEGRDASQLSHQLPPHSKLEGRVRSTLSRADIIEDMTQPRITFHGTVLKNVASIVRYGFRLPGRMVNGKLVASPRSGIVFDRGVYSSHSPTYAMSYAEGQSEVTPVGKLPSMRLFVCATLMGRTFRGPLLDKIHGPLVEGYDSHFDKYFEYIIHDERAMLPCYVIHLDLGSEEAKKALEEAQRDPMQFYNSARSSKANAYSQRREVLSKEERRREKEARKAAAMKWFPYGFGPATGTNFVIEEVGEISDDEEEYGDWQADKHAYVHQWVEEEEANTYDDWDEEGNPIKRKRGLFMDQYQYAVR